MIYNYRGRIISLTPDDLFSCYTEFMSLLSPNALNWSFSLVTLFFIALPLELQETVRLGSIFYLTFRDYLPLFCRNRRYKFCVSTHLPLLSYLQRRNITFVESWLNLIMEAAPLKIFW